MSRNGHTPVLGIMGLGVVGDAAREYLEQQGHTLALYDPYKSIGSSYSINEADIVFICVPTPYTPGVGFDSSALEDAVSTLHGSKTVVIKSTVVPQTTDRYQLRYPQHRFLFNPEFLRESTAREDFKLPDRQLVGYTLQSESVAEQVMSLLPPAPYMRTMPAREAELTKYMTNSFLAIKVTFANEIYDLACALGADFDTVRDAVAADVRIGPSHLEVMHGHYRGYGGKCLPKDTKALMQLGEQLGVPLRLLEAADMLNGLLQRPESPQLLPDTAFEGMAEFEDAEVAA
jgi:UDPglucose 6-dehydrogenase